MNSKLIVIVGETASGKSALAMELAQKFKGELICADSWTVYKGFDIGTAKPTAEERTLVPHHLLDVADPRAGFSAPQFKERANQAVDDIAARGNLPIMVGGTGLYVDSVLYDYGFLDDADPERRIELNAMELTELQSIVEKAGLDTGNIDMQNKRRVVRLIENDGAKPQKSKLRDSTLILGIMNDRDELRQRITDRVDGMLEQGLEAEVRRLAETYGWEAEPMKGIGYVEWREYIAGTQILGQTRDQIVKASMDLAKRQRTWFKRNDSIQWLDDPRNAVEIVTTFLNKTR